MDNYLVFQRLKDQIDTILITSLLPCIKKGNLDLNIDLIGSNLTSLQKVHYQLNTL